MCLLFGRGDEEAALRFKRFSTSSVCKVPIIFFKKNHPSSESVSAQR